ncbi:unnamed protein product [Penicillium roqueforti FM164]|uniref:Major facilitator superfamily domain, general substrate transporter n=1 Tax=Penicillium roqueforti (strain FM164) TaxID=1365484 RepID=W6QJP8_PENRF|nr:unnamed protein product [Penicillium roqueforti FM164]
MPRSTHNLRKEMRFGFPYRYIRMDGASFLLLYYIPIWFQGAPGTSPFGAGVDTLPLGIANALSSLLGGILIGPHLAIPHFWFEIYFPRGRSVHHIHDRHRHGKMDWVPNSLRPWHGWENDKAINYCHVIDSAIFTGVAQSLFINHLDQNIAKTDIPSIDTSQIMTGGVMTLTNGLHGADKIAVLDAFNKAMVDMWLLPLALCCIKIIGAVIVERRKIRGREKETKESASAPV